MKMVISVLNPWSLFKVGSIIFQASDLTEQSDTINDEPSSKKLKSNDGSSVSTANQVSYFWKSSEKSYLI